VGLVRAQTMGAQAATNGGLLRGALLAVVGMSEHGGIDPGHPIA
jgi:hypothetical protein